MKCMRKHGGISNKEIFRPRINGRFFLLFAFRPHLIPIIDIEAGLRFPCELTTRLIVSLYDVVLEISMVIE